MKIVFTPPACVSFRKPWPTISAPTNRPLRFLSDLKAEKVLSRLLDYPESGRTLPEFPDTHYREVIVTPYRFFYRVKDDVVWVVAVWHGTQIPEKPS